MATITQPTTTDIDGLCINTIRTLSIDAIQKANSGHPGTPMAMAPVAYTLWQRFLRFDPSNPIWPNRDRFVLSALCSICDTNHISIDGATELAYSDDVAARFIGYGWNVTRVGDANDLDLLTRAFDVFRREEGRPTLIIVDSHIGYGSPHKQDTPEAHGEPLGEEEVRETKRTYGWPEDAQFLIPDGVYEHFEDGVGARGARLRTEWAQRVSDAGPERAAEIDEMQRRELPEGWDAEIPSFEADPGGIATRKASNEVLNAIAPRVPWLVSGSADLTRSAGSGVTLDDARTLSPEGRS